MTETTADRLRRIADEDIGGNAPWLADELREVARKLELEWAGVYTGPAWDPCADCDGRGYHADGEPCATCFGSGQIPAGRKDADDA